MTNDQEKINELHQRLDVLIKKQQGFLKEIHELREELKNLKADKALAKEEIIQQPVEQIKPEVTKESRAATPEIADQAVEPKKVDPIHVGPEQMEQQAPAREAKRVTSKSSLEKFIGENLINKIGIAITVIGVAIGAKYSIENDLISPLTRIILGYLTGIGLLGFGIKLKKKYEGYSAVLVSGAIAILYFITYAAYAFYGLFPQVMAFALMVVFTGFTVIAAIHYNQQVIAHIGLVGAYAVPFLLSEGSGKVEILFSYMAIINTGILIISFKKYWKSIYYVAFALTWLIYVSWFAISFNLEEHYNLALIFLSIFFAIFYSTFLAYKLVRREKYGAGDVLMLLINSFIFYGLGLAILNEEETGSQLLGLFTLGNAVIHFITSTVIYRMNLADKKLFYLFSGLVLVFVTIAVPIQLDGNWVTLIWVALATLLFWIGRTKDVPVYEKLSYILMVLACISILHDWSWLYHTYHQEVLGSRITPLLNVNFLNSLFFACAFGFINFVYWNKKYKTAFGQGALLTTIINFMLPAIFISGLYMAFRMEITNYWYQLGVDTMYDLGAENGGPFRDMDVDKFKTIWILIYTMLFLSLLSVINMLKIRKRFLGLTNLGLNTLGILVFLLQGLLVLSELRESYLDRALEEYYDRGIFNLGIRYVSLMFLALLLFVSYKYIRQDFIKKDFRVAFELLLHTIILWVASSELIHWLDIYESSTSYKLGLSILWGMYALFLIGYGIWKKRRFLRIGAFVLFGLTLVKLFFYDISHLNTISKTIVFVSLGILLLIISFLYNKYKHIITDEDEK